MLIHLINLDRCTDRLTEFVAFNRHLTAISRVPAIDGTTLDIPSLSQKGLVGDGLVSKDFYTIGALGAALSHVSLWQTAIESNETLTIAEDDAIFHSQFEVQAPELINTLPTDWDFILWGWNFDLFLCFEMMAGVSFSLCQFEQDRLRENIAQFQQQPIATRAFKLRWAFGIPCYSITPKGARALQSKCLPLRPTIASFPPAARVPPHAQHFRNVGIDSAMNNAWAELNAYICFPPMVVSRNEANKSTIQALTT
jgi:GR25 family glycosyltransferase involved in LPS biosynthesis